MRFLVLSLLLLSVGLPAVQLWASESDMVEPERLPPPAPWTLPKAYSTTGTTPYTITALFLYTPDTVRLYGSKAAVQARINQLVSFANAAYLASGVNLELVQAAADLVYYDNDNTTATAFSQLANKTHPAFTGVNRRRRETGADFVVLLRPQKSDSAVCGKAFFVGNVANPPTDYWALGGYAYAHVSINCYDFVLAHELGHIMGLAHSRTAVGEPAAGKAYAYGAGYKVNNDFNTIMASTVGYTPVACCTYLPVFSSPDNKCKGKKGIQRACGVDSTLSNGADAVRAINNIAEQLPHFSDDSDGDGMPDWFEHFWGLDRFNAADAFQDADGDGLGNIAEFELETYAKPITGLPNTTDTDGDGIPDGQDPLPTIAGFPVLDLGSEYRGSLVEERVHP